MPATIFGYFMLILIFVIAWPFGLVRSKEVFIFILYYVPTVLIIEAIVMYVHDKKLLEPAKPVYLLWFVVGIIVSLAANIELLNDGEMLFVFMAMDQLCGRYVK